MLIATKVLVMDLYAVQYAIISNQKPKHKAKQENNSKPTKNKPTKNTPGRGPKVKRKRER